MAGVRTFRAYPVLGNDSTVQNLFVLVNDIASRVNVKVRRLTIQNDPILALATVVPIIKTSRIEHDAFSGGVMIDPEEFDTTMPASSHVKAYVPLFESARITCNTPGTVVWQHYPGRLHDATGQVLAEDYNVLSGVSEIQDFYLRPGEALLVRVMGATNATNAALTNNWVVECMYETVDIATFAISGTVTLSGSPVVGAKIIVMEAKDTSLTDAILYEVTTTIAGGAWSSTIRSGWVGAVFVQYENGGTKYTASGSPFIQNT